MDLNDLEASSRGTSAAAARIALGRDLTVREVADITGQAPETVRSLVRSGAFPGAYKTGTGGRTSHVRIPQDDLDAWRQGRRIAG